MQTPKKIEGIVIGGHGDTTMIPLVRFAAYRGVPATNYIDADRLATVAADTMVGGATLTKLLGTSAWYAPGAAAAQVVSAVLHDEKKLISCSALLDGEYGESDLCIGVPCILGKTVSRRSLNSPSTTKKKTSSTRAQRLFTKQTLLWQVSSDPEPFLIRYTLREDGIIPPLPEFFLNQIL